MKQCPLCTATYEESQHHFLVSYGDPMSELKWNSRCCHYARARGRQGCINPCLAVDNTETLEGRTPAPTPGILDRIPPLTLVQP